MTDIAELEITDPNLMELVKASLQLRPFLRASTDEDFVFSDIDAAKKYVDEKLSITEAERLRRSAEKMEATDAAIARFRRALEAFA
jgi:hypothetical protein